MLQRVLAAAEWWEVVSAVGAALGALAAAVGAIAAWRAASASRATSRDALEALAVGIRPRLRVSVADEYPAAKRIATVENVSEWPARDLVFELRLRDGTVQREESEQLDPVKGLRGGTQWFVVLEGSSPGGPSLEASAKSIVVRYSDDRRIARYEHTMAFLHTESRTVRKDGGEFVSSTSSIELDDRRVD